MLPIQAAILGVDEISYGYQTASHARAERSHRTRRSQAAPPRPRLVPPITLRRFVVSRSPVQPTLVADNLVTALEPFHSDPLRTALNER